ncbi:hypothetical protein EV368DRAFT_63564 [Lentinula lateritia]|nr:hypothetical protein EV368DRAFT_63564 [Lentinula lateritia]
MADQEGEFSFGTRLGLAFTVQSACCSALLVSSLLIYIFKLLFFTRLFEYSAVVIKRGATRTWKVSTHVHCYFVNLLIFDLIQAIGGMIDVKWVADAGVTEGSLCTAQGLSIATHKGKDYYGNTEYWCWITGHYGFERIALEYFWLWLAAFINLVCYGIMALVVKGILVVDGRRFRFIGWKGHGFQNGIRMLSNIDKLTGADRVQANDIAMRMLFSHEQDSSYPLIYLAGIVPITVVRFMAFAGSSVPFPATAFASITFSSSGVFNVVLFAMTRPKLLPHRIERAPPRHFSFSVGLGPPPPIPQSPSRYTHSSIDSNDGPSWKMTPPTLPSQLPLLHPHS